MLLAQTIQGGKMPYEFYKVLHIASVLILLACTSANLMGGPKKMIKIIGGIASLFILVGGMGLLARLNLRHEAGWPMWVIGKMMIWAILAIGGPIAAKRIKGKRQTIWVTAIFLAIVSTTLAVYKP